MFTPTMFSRRRPSEGGMMRFETLVELKFVNYNSSSFVIIGVRQTILYRAIRANKISINSIPPALHLPARQPASFSKAPKGNGIGAKGSKNPRAY